MKNKKSSTHKWIWLSALILFVCVCVTTIIFTNRLNTYVSDDNGAIPLIPEGTGETEENNTENNNEGNNESSGTTGTPSSGGAGTTEPPKNPGFETEDDQKVWSTNTQVEVFRVSYEDGEQAVTVQSSNGDKVIAPGTENSYTFKLKNTGNVALDYTVEVDAYFTPADIEIPITGRLNRYDGTWIVGGKDTYAAVCDLDVAEDKAILGAGKYTYYTLDWLWPFESGDDESDTILGNIAAEQDLIFTLVITTIATESADPNADGGLTPPQTGDDSQLALWIALAGGSFFLMLILIFYQSKEKRRQDAEAKRSEKVS